MDRSIRDSADYSVKSFMSTGSDSPAHSGFVSVNSKNFDASALVHHWPTVNGSYFLPGTVLPVNTIYGRTYALFNGGVQVPLTGSGCAILEAGGTYTAESIHSDALLPQQTGAMSSQGANKGSKMQLKKLSRDASESGTLKRMGSEFTTRMKTLSKLALSVDPSATRSLDVMNPKHSGDGATTKSQTLNLMDTVRVGQKSKRPTASGAVFTDVAVSENSHSELPNSHQAVPAKFMSVDRLSDFTGTITTADILANVDKVSGAATITGVDYNGQRRDGRKWCSLEDYFLTFHETDDETSPVAFSFPVESVDFTRETFSMDGFAFDLKHHGGSLSLLVPTKESLIQWVGSINTAVNNILLGFGLAGIQRKFEETSGDPDELFPMEFSRFMARMQNQEQSRKRRSRNIDEEGGGEGTNSEAQETANTDDLNEDAVVGSLIRQISTNFLSGGDTIRYQKGPDGIESTSIIVAATLDKLIERLSGERMDTDFVENFLLCYRHFTDSATVLSKLIQRMCVQPPPGATKDQTDYVRHWRALVKLRAAMVVAKWIEGFWADFIAPESSRKLANFLKRLSECNSTNEEDRRHELKFKVDFEQVVEVLKATMGTAEKNHRRRMQAAAKVSESVRRHGLPEFIDMEPKEVALRLTLLEHEKFRRVRPIEFVLQIWGDQKDTNVLLETKNIREMIDSFNHVSYWAATEIVTQPEIKNRMKVVEKMIKIAKELRRLNNFNSLLAVVSGLNNSCVSRLKSTWEALPSKVIEARAELERVVNPEGNFGVYRGIYSSFQRGDVDSTGVSSAPASAKPFIPIFSLIMKDFLFVNDGNPRFADESGPAPLINWAKLTMISEAVRTIERLQRTPYTFPDAFSTDMPQNYYQTLSDKVLYKYSQLCEARAGESSTTRLVDKVGRAARRLRDR
ncbi:hypothetical protein HDU93_007846 [Gonapodya sp. JEL0774]|nr:hypothetical protein HDU93_007846 [Gonapodya sp. JEL0774]